MQFPHSSYRLRKLLKKQPSIGQLMDLCGENYALIMKLLPELKQLQGDFQSSLTNDTALHLQIIEQSPYTSLIRLTYLFGDQQQHADPDSTLRVYHDSQQLEIIDLRRSKLYLTNTYQHPNLLIKWKANLFMHKWLTYCLAGNHDFVKHEQQPACSKQPA